MAARVVLNNISYHGKGAIENIASELQRRGKKKVLVCTDESLIKFGVAQKVTSLLEKAGIAFEIYRDCTMKCVRGKYTGGKHNGRKQTGKTQN